MTQRLGCFLNKGAVHFHMLEKDEESFQQPHTFSLMMEMWWKIWGSSNLHTLRTTDSWQINSRKHANDRSGKWTTFLGAHFSSFCLLYAEYTITQRPIASKEPTCHILASIETLRLAHSQNLTICLSGHG